MQSLTIVDVIENYFGELPGSDDIVRMDEDEIGRFGEEVNRFALSYRPDRIATGHFYAGGWGSGSFEGREGPPRLARQLLYAPGFVVHDPLAEWFFPYRTAIETMPGLRVQHRRDLVFGPMHSRLHGDGHFASNVTLDRQRHMVGIGLDFIRSLAPFIRSAEVVAVSQLEIIRRHQAALMTAVRHNARDSDVEDLLLNLEEGGDPAPIADNVRGCRVTPNRMDKRDERRSVVQDPMYYLYKTLAVAADTGALYVPQSPGDVRLFEHVVDEARPDLGASGVDLAVSFGLAEAELPFLDGLDADTLIRAREDEPAFEAWRASLSMAGRVVVASSADDGGRFLLDAGEAIRGSILPAADEVRRAVEQSPTLRTAVRALGIGFAAGAAGLAGGAAAGVPITLAGAAAMASSTSGAWALQALFGGGGETRHAFLAAIYQRE